MREKPEEIFCHIRERDSDEDDSDYEHEKELIKSKDNNYTKTLTKVRYGIRYFQKSGNPKFISPRFLPTIK